MNAVALRSRVLHHVSASPGRKLRDEENTRRLVVRWHREISILGEPPVGVEVTTGPFFGEDPRDVPDAARGVEGGPVPGARAAHAAPQGRRRDERGDRQGARPLARIGLRLSMEPLPHTPPFGGAFARRFTRFSELFFDEFATNSAWIRETAVVQLPPIVGLDEIVLRGEILRHPEVARAGVRVPDPRGPPRRTCAVATVSSPAGPWQVRIALDPRSAQVGSVLSLRLHGVRLTNALAWLGRVTLLGPLQRFRRQNRNRQMRVLSIESGSGERIYDFSMRESPYCVAFTRAHLRSGMNIVGFFAADLGIGESARCMARAADAASIPVSLVPLKLNCKNRLGDATFAGRLQDANPHGVNVFHVDPPVARDIDHHHGAEFRRHKYNIGYFAWELPEFPDGWMPSFDYFDEVWCPSAFVCESIVLKAPFPVVTMPHAIGFARPAGSRESLRARFGLPQDSFLFLCLFDLNSYTARKNPRAALEAFRLSGLAGRGAALVIKVQNADANASDFAALAEAVRDLPGTVILSSTLSRADVYALEAACDCYVSLHRSEGFGLAVAECMYLGKPVLSTELVGDGGVPRLGKRPPGAVLAREAHGEPRAVREGLDLGRARHRPCGAAHAAHPRRPVRGGPPWGGRARVDRGPVLAGRDRRPVQAPPGDDRLPVGPTPAGDGSGPRTRPRARSGRSLPRTATGRPPGPAGSIRRRPRRSRRRRHRCP